MNPQIQALLQMLLSGGGSQTGAGSPNYMSQMQPNMGSNMGSQQIPDNEGIMNFLNQQGPLSNNQNYGETVKGFFDTNPLAGGNQFQGVQHSQPGQSGMNAIRGGQGWSSFMPKTTDTFQNWTGGQ